MEASLLLVECVVLLVRKFLGHIAIISTPSMITQYQLAMYTINMYRFPVSHLLLLSPTEIVTNLTSKCYPRRCFRHMDILASFSSSGGKMWPLLLKMRPSSLRYDH